MKVLRHTLVSDGPTDANLIPILNWTLRQVDKSTLPHGARAEFWRLPTPPKTLAEKLNKALELHPCDVLFVHRDTENQTSASRVTEIREAFESIEGRMRTPAVAVVPVRMLEAWLCFDQHAIRRAAGNPNGRVRLDLPDLKRVEKRPDPKAELRQALLDASELSGRRLNKFDVSRAFWRIIDYIDDFTPLRQLSAFQALEDSLKVLRKNNWKPGYYG